MNRAMSMGVAMLTMLALTAPVAASELQIDASPCASLAGGVAHTGGTE